MQALKEDLLVRVHQQETAQYGQKTEWAITILFTKKINRINDVHDMVIIVAKLSRTNISAKDHRRDIKNQIQRLPTNSEHNGVCVTLGLTVHIRKTKW